MAVFRCKRSGNTVQFSNETDIESMRKHDGYEEVKDGETPVVRHPDEDTRPIKRGRPRKVTEN